MVFFLLFIQFVIEHSVNSGEPDQTPQNTPRSAASDLGLHCFSNKKEARLIGVYEYSIADCVPAMYLIFPALNVSLNSDGLQTKSNVINPFMPCIPYIINSQIVETQNMAIH